MTAGSFRQIVLALVVCVLLAAQAQGASFEISSSGLPTFPFVAAGDDGHFLAVWLGTGERGSPGQPLTARLMDRDGSPLTEEMVMVDSSLWGKPAAGLDGEFLVVSLADDGRRIEARRISAEGVPHPGSTVVSKAPAGTPFDRSLLQFDVVTLTDGRLVVPFAKTAVAGNVAQERIVARYLDPSSGQTVGDRVAVSDASLNDDVAAFILTLVDAAALPRAGFAVAWIQQEVVASSGLLRSRILVRLFAGDGSPLTPPTVVHSVLEEPDRVLFFDALSIAALPKGGLIVAWLESDGFLDGSNEIRTRRIDPSGEPRGPAHVASKPDTFFIITVDIDVSGRKPLLVWDEVEIAGPSSLDVHVIARRTSKKGRPKGRQMRLNEDTDNNHHSPAIAAVPGGGFIVVWTREFIPVSNQPVTPVRTILGSRVR